MKRIPENRERVKHLEKITYDKISKELTGNRWRATLSGGALVFLAAAVYPAYLSVTGAEGNGSFMLGMFVAYVIIVILASAIGFRISRRSYLAAMMQDRRQILTSIDRSWFLYVAVYLVISLVFCAVGGMYIGLLVFHLPLVAFLFVLTGLMLTMLTFSIIQMGFLKTRADAEEA